jgi:hypothetical protein
VKVRSNTVAQGSLGLAMLPLVLWGLVEFELWHRNWPDVYLLSHLHWDPVIFPLLWLRRALVAGAILASWYRVRRGSYAFALLFGTGVAVAALGLPCEPRVLAGEHLLVNLDKHYEGGGEYIDLIVDHLDWLCGGESWLLLGAAALQAVGESVGLGWEALRGRVAPA